MLILLALSQGTYRWAELRRTVQRISEKMLASTLRTLQDDGSVLCTAYPEVPTRVEYALTPRGRELAERMLPLMDWITDNADEILAGERVGRTRAPGPRGSGRYPGTSEFHSEGTGCRRARMLPRRPTRS